MGWRLPLPVVEGVPLLREVLTRVLRVSEKGEKMPLGQQAPGKEPRTAPALTADAAKTKGERQKRSLSPSHAGLKGPPVDLPVEKMNADEIATVRAFVALGGGPLLLKDLAGAAFPVLKGVKGNSKVRNALRRVVRGQWAEQVSRGTYKLTKSGKLRTKKAVFQKTTTP